MSGFDEINNFGDAWRGTENFVVTAVGHFIFCSDVAYKSAARGLEVEICTVQIFRNGAKDGNIEIYAESPLSSDSHHLGFSATHQAYVFSSTTKALIVKGNSPKMKGDYVVTLRPNGREPNVTG